MRTVEIVAARMKAHEGCEARSVETRQSRRAELRKNGIVKPTTQKNRLNGPRWMRAAKQIAARRCYENRKYVSLSCLFDRSHIG